MIDPKVILQMSSDLENAKKAKEAAKREYDSIDSKNSSALAEMDAQYSQLETRYQRDKSIAPNSPKVAAAEKELLRLRTKMDGLNSQITEAMLKSSRAATKYFTQLKDFNEKTKSSEEGKGA